MDGAALKLVNRCNELEQLEKAIKDGKSALVVGMPGIGKTRLLSHLADQSVQDVCFYLCNCREISCAEGFWMTLVSALSSDLDCKEKFGGCSSEDLLGVLQCQRQQSKCRRVFLIDDFDSLLIDNIIKNDDLCNFFSKTSQYNFLFVAAIRPGTLTKLPDRDFEQNISIWFPKSIWLQALGPDSTNKMVKDLAGLQEFQSQELKNIYTFSGGNPRLVKILSTLYARGYSLKEIRAILLSGEEISKELKEGNVFDDDDRLRSKVLEDIWQDLNEGTRYYLNCVAWNTHPVPEEEHWWFEKTGLLKFDEDTPYIFSDAFKEYIKHKKDKCNLHFLENRIFLVTVYCMCLSGIWLFQQFWDYGWVFKVIISLVGPFFISIIVSGLGIWHRVVTLRGLKCLWGILWVIYVVLAILLLSLKASLWFFPATIGALFAFITWLRLQMPTSFVGGGDNGY